MIDPETLKRPVVPLHQKDFFDFIKPYHLESIPVRNSWAARFMWNEMTRAEVFPWVTTHVKLNVPVPRDAVICTKYESKIAKSQLFMVAVNLKRFTISGHHLVDPMIWSLDDPKLLIVSAVDDFLQRPDGLRWS